MTARSRASPSATSGGASSQRVCGSRSQPRSPTTAAPAKPISRVVVTSASQRKSCADLAPRTRAFPSDRPSRVPSRSRVSSAVAPATSGASHRGGTRSGSVGPYRDSAGRSILKRKLVGDRRSRHGRRGDGGKPDPEGDRGREPPRPAAVRAEDPARDAEAGEERRAEDREHPRVGSLERGKEGLEALFHELADEARERRQEDDHRRHAEPRDRPERHAAPRRRGPGDRRDRDTERRERRDPYQEVGRAPGPIAGDQQDRDDRPQHGDADGKEAELEQADSHGGQSSEGAAGRRRARCRRVGGGPRRRRRHGRQRRACGPGQGRTSTRATLSPVPDWRRSTPCDPRSASRPRSP